MPIDHNNTTIRSPKIQYLNKFPEIQQLTYYVSWLMTFVNCQISKFLTHYYGQVRYTSKFFHPSPRTRLNIFIMLSVSQFNFLHYSLYEMWLHPDLVWLFYKIFLSILIFSICRYYFYIFIFYPSFITFFRSVLQC